MHKKRQFLLRLLHIKNGNFCTLTTKKINDELARCATVANSVRSCFEALLR